MDRLIVCVCVWMCVNGQRWAYTTHTLSHIYTHTGIRNWIQNSRAQRHIYKHTHRHANLVVDTSGEVAVLQLPLEPPELWS
jgi:hypothetical protein